MRICGGAAEKQRGRQRCAQQVQAAGSAAAAAVQSAGRVQCRQQQACSAGSAEAGAGAVAGVRAEQAAVQAGRCAGSR